MSCKFDYFLCEERDFMSIVKDQVLVTNTHTHTHTHTYTHTNTHPQTNKQTNTQTHRITSQLNQKEFIFQGENSQGNTYN